MYLTEKNGVPNPDLKRQCHKIFDIFLWIEPIWAPDKQANMV